MNARYVALTIGPVFATLQNARSTKAIWAASYMFSWIMQEILAEIVKVPGVQLLNLAYNAKQTSGKKGVGLFPDRFVARVDPNTSVDLQVIARKILDKLADEMADDFKNTNRRVQAGSNSLSIRPDKVEIRKFLSDYLRLLAIDFELPVSDNNPVKTADDFLNSLELQASFVPEQAFDLLGLYFEELLYNWFIRREFAPPGFLSTPEIATQTFRKGNEKEYDKAANELRDWDSDDSEDARRKQEGFIDAVKKIAEKRFKLCHRHIAIVHADGDNMGYLFRRMAEKDHETKGQQNFAQTLANNVSAFSLAAVELIRNFGGVPVYAGGDDLLFFAPVSIDDKEGARRNVFQLLDDLNRCFATELLGKAPLDAAMLDELRQAGKAPSLSFGVSISHHKFPLGESLRIAQEDMLFQAIKSDGRRNGVAWRVTKHSGTGFGCVIDKTPGRPVVDAFNTLAAAKFPKGEKPEQFLSSVIFKLEDLEGLFRATAAKPGFRDYFYQILFNNFNETIHRDPENRQLLSPYLQKVHALLTACFVEQPISSTNSVEKTEALVKANLDKAYALLRYLHFLDTSDKS